MALSVKDHQLNSSIPIYLCKRKTCGEYRKDIVEMLARANKPISLHELPGWLRDVKDLENMSLKDALQSKMLRTIRENHGDLKEIHGCALWEKREWVRLLANPETDVSEEQ